MENRGSADDVDDVVEDASDDDDERESPAGAADRTADLREAKIKEEDFAEEFPSGLPSIAVSPDPTGSHPNPSSQVSSASKVDGRDVAHVGSVSGCKKLEHAPPHEPMPSTVIGMIAGEFPFGLPSIAMSSDPSGSHPNPSLQVSPASKVDSRYVAHVGSVSGSKKLEHAPPSEPMPSTGLGMIYSSERPPVVHASNYDVNPGAFPVVPSSRNTGSRPRYESSRQLTSEESKQEGDGVPNSAGASAGLNEGTREATESGLYAVEAQLAPDGNDEGAPIVAEAQLIPDGNDEGATMVAKPKSVTAKWYQRRWILACGLVGAVVVTVVLAVLSQSALVSPTEAPTFSSPELIACKFISIPNVTECRATDVFDTFNKTTGSTIPSEIGLLTQLTYLDFNNNDLYSTIPSEIGLLTQLRWLTFKSNALTSTIPSEIGLLERLTMLDFYNNLLTSTIPSEIGLLTKLTYLSLFNNSLTSSLPSEIGFLTQLTYLYLYNNDLNSTIPSEVGLLTQLTYLDFMSNLLTSTIPSDLGHLTQLTVLDFTFNSLTSKIPSEIGLLTQLTYLSLYKNLLTSTIPSEIGLLSQLERLFLDSNTLTGTIPSSLCTLPYLNGSIFIDCGEITCDSGCCYDYDTLSSCG